MRSITSAQLLTRLERMTDTENDPHISTAEKYEILSSAVAETWDMILGSGVGDEFVKSVSFSTIAGQLEYAIATIVAAGDFYKVSQLYVDEGNGQLRPIGRISVAEINAYRAPADAVPMKLYYAPCAPVWTDGTGSFDGINGWEEHTLLTAAITIKNKKQDDARPYESRKRFLEARIQTMANRSQGEPPRVVRKLYQAKRDKYSPWRHNVSAWNLRGTNLELYYRFGY